jgi:hypothetical protein
LASFCPPFPLGLIHTYLGHNLKQVFDTYLLEGNMGGKKKENREGRKKWKEGRKYLEIKMEN